jgi:hypothetical protein
MQLVFSNSTTNQSASVRITTFKNPAITVWDVVLYGIPLSEQGKEVTVNWKTYNITHNDTFYTDSNALEMQKRIVDFRPTWNFTTDEHISGNYFPVNSAIAIVDPVTQL